jgi:hypothetical protein
MLAASLVCLSIYVCAPVHVDKLVSLPLCVWWVGQHTEREGNKRPPLSLPPFCPLYRLGLCVCVRLPSFSYFPSDRPPCHLPCSPAGRALVPPVLYIEAVGIAVRGSIFEEPPTPPPLPFLPLKELTPRNRRSNALSQF